HWSRYTASPPRPRLAGATRSSTTMNVAIDGPCSGCLRDGPGNDALIKLGVLAGHRLGRETLLRPGPDPAPVQGETTEDLLPEVGSVRRTVAGDPVVDDLGRRPDARGDDGGAAQHRFHLHQAEWLRVLQRVEQGPRPAQELVLRSAGDVTDVLDPAPIHQGRNLLP